MTDKKMNCWKSQFVSTIRDKKTFFFYAIISITLTLMIIVQAASPLFFAATNSGQKSLAGNVEVDKEGLYDGAEVDMDVRNAENNEYKKMVTKLERRDFFFAPYHSTGKCNKFYKKYNIIQNLSQCNKFKRLEKNLVISVHVGTPRLIYLQKLSLDFFMKEPFQYVIYDDSIDTPEWANHFQSNNSQRIKEAAYRVNATYRKIPREIHEDRRCLFPRTLEPFTQNPNVRVSNILQFIFRDGKNFCSRTKVVFLEADVFLTRNFNTSEYLASSNASFAGVVQSRGVTSPGLSLRITYIWNPVLVYDLLKMPGLLDINFDCGRASFISAEKSIHAFDYIDTSGHLFEWLHNHKPIIKFMSVNYLNGNKDPFFSYIQERWSERNGNSSLRSEIIENTFIHTRNGGNWMVEVSNKSLLIGLQIFTEYLHILRKNGTVQIT